MLDKILKKKNIFILGLIGPIWFFFLWYLDSFSNLGGPCYGTYLGWCGTISNLIEQTTSIVLPLGLLLFFSVISFFLRQQTFRAWAHFSLVYIPVTILFSLLPDGSRSSSGFGPGLNISFKDFLSLLLLIIYIIVSTIILIVKSLSRKPVVS